MSSQPSQLTQGPAPEAEERPLNEDGRGRLFAGGLPLLRGMEVERQLAVLQWALPLFLTLIVLIYETSEHVFGKREGLLSPNFVGETFFFGVVGPAAVALVLRWLRGEWRARERDRRTLQRMFDELAEAQERLHELHRQRGELLKRLMTLQEDERRRLARELHDELGQLLTGLSLHLKVSRESVPPDLQQVRVYLTRAEELVQETLTSAHRLIADLRPTVLDDYGLVAALREELHERLEPLGIRVLFTHEGQAADLPPEVTTAAYRICQEAVTNIIRHAGATEVKVHLALGDSTLTLVVEDDGVGISASGPHGEAGTDSGFGIPGMRERAWALGGQLEVSPRQPRGTRVTLTIPLETRHE